MLYNNCAIFSIYMEFFLANYEELITGDFNLKNEFDNLISRNSDYLIFNKNKSNTNDGIKYIIKAFEKELGKGFIQKHHSELIEFWKEGSGFSPAQVDYMGRLFIKWTTNGNKYEKNDIMDMMILRALDMDNSVLITFDKSMQDFIFDINHLSRTYIERYYNES